MTDEPSGDSDTAAQGGSSSELEALSGDGAKVLGDYALERLIAKGAAGFIFRARRKDAPADGSADVALKVLRPNLLDKPAAIKRFERESELLAKVAHPNFIQVRESGRFHKLPFYAMEFVEGDDLERYVRQRGRAPARWAVQLVRVLAEATAFLHRKGIVHRDIKPHNVLVEASTRRPVLTDLGVAKRVEGLAESWDGVFRGAGSITRLGEVVGTPAYMAPEQLDPKLRKVGPRSDIYGLGATLYYLLLGLPPFEAANLYELLRAVKEEPPLGVREVRASLPVDLERLIASCLAKEPERRPGSAQELARALEAIERELPDEPSAQWGEAWAPEAAAEVARAAPEAAPAQAAEAPAASGAPVDFGPFEVIEELDRDATGVLSRARKRGQGRLMLLKRAHSARASVLERFRREMQALAAITHPNIMPVLQAGDVEGVPWFTMDLPSGDHLGEVIASGRRLPVEKALGLGVKVARALELMHSKGLVHRSLSPRAIYLTIDFEPLLMGFSAVGRLGGMTLAGDPEYRAPEQDEGAAVDATVDLYALAGVLFELLTGEPPRGGEGSLAARLREVPAGPRAALQRALDPDPRLRYPGAGAFAEALEGGGGTVLGRISKRVTGLFSRRKLDLDG